MRPVFSSSSSSAVSNGASALAPLLTALDELELKTGRIVVPLAYADELYALRAHIHMVRQKVMQLQ